MKLSEHIAELQELYNKYGDGTIYTLDDCATHEAIGVEEEIEYDYHYNPQTEDVERTVKEVKYHLYGYGYSY